MRFMRPPVRRNSSFDDNWCKDYVMNFESAAPKDEEIAEEEEREAINTSPAAEEAKEMFFIGPATTTDDNRVDRDCEDGADDDDGMFDFESSSSSASAQFAASGCVETGSVYEDAVSLSRMASIVSSARVVARSAHALRTTGKLMKKRAAKGLLEKLPFPSVLRTFNSVLSEGAWCSKVSPRGIVFFLPVLFSVPYKCLLTPIYCIAENYVYAFRVGEIEVILRGWGA